MLMALKARGITIFLLIFILSLLDTFTVCNGDKTDIYCLKSIKESLEDTSGYLKYSWNFFDHSEGFICKFAGVECWHTDENRVLNLRLSNMGLKGSFPRGIENCTSLTGLDLSNNKLSGPLPVDIADMIPYLTYLNLSNNSFSGEIPSSIFNCSYLSFLILDKNNLTGEIPQNLGLLNRISVFRVANNQLSGQVPNLVSAFPAESFANNSGLCGKPLDPCNGKKGKFDESFTRGFVVGYAVSTVSVITIFISYCVPWVHVKKGKKMTVTTMIVLMTRKKNKRKEANQVSESPAMELQHKQESSKEISVLENVVTRMSFSELSKATKNFSEDNVIGLGKMGMMYKATLPNGWFLAVKRLHNSQHHEKPCISELKILGKLRHDNLVPLLGFSIKGKKKLLVYKYMSNGNLYDWLHPVEVGAKIMEWPLRVKIALGLARGLVWLHHNSNLRVVHLNISSKCILLDQKFEPKISNFGRAMFMNPNESNDTDSSWSFSVNSEFWELGLVKNDVFNFGIVLLELITGKEPSQVSSSSKGSDGSLAEWMNHISTNSSGLYDVIDKSLIRKGFDAEIFLLLRVACNCVQPFPDRRPTMFEVYKAIRKTGERYGLIEYSDELLKQTEIAIEMNALMLK